MKNILYCGFSSPIKLVSLVKESKYTAYTWKLSDCRSWKAWGIIEIEGGEKLDFQINLLRFGWVVVERPLQTLWFDSNHAVMPISFILTL